MSGSAKDLDKWREEFLDITLRPDHSQETHGMLTSPTAFGGFSVTCTCGETWAGEAKMVTRATARHVQDVARRRTR